MASKTADNIGLTVVALSLVDKARSSNGYAMACYLMISSQIVYQIVYHYHMHTNTFATIDEVIGKQHRTMNFKTVKPPRSLKLPRFTAGNIDCIYVYFLQKQLPENIALTLCDN